MIREIGPNMFVETEIHEWPIPAFEKPKAARCFKSSLNCVWIEMRAEAAARAVR